MTTNPSTSFGPRALRALLAGWAVLLLAAAPLAAQATDTTVQKSGASAPTPDTTVVATQPATASARADTAPGTGGATQNPPRREPPRPLAENGGWTEIPSPVGRAIIAIILLGALGALAGDLVADGTRLERWRREENVGWILGFPGRLLIGVVAALIVVLGMAQPNGSWPTLIATALGVGAASEAVLLGIMASWKTRAAEQDSRQTRAAAVTNMRRMGVEMKLLNARQAERVLRALPEAGGAAMDDFDAMVDGLVERAVDEFTAETAVTLP